MDQLDNETMEFLGTALNYTPASDLAFLLETSNGSCTRAAFTSLLLTKSVEVTDRAHQMGYDTNGHRYFSIPLPSDAEMAPISRMNPLEMVKMVRIDAHVHPRPVVDHFWMGRTDESVVRVSRGNGENWYVTSIFGGPLVSREPATLNLALEGREMTAADARELGFTMVQLPVFV